MTAPASADDVRIVPLVVGSLANERNVFEPSAVAGDVVAAPSIVWVVWLGDRALVVDTGTSGEQRAHSTGHRQLRRAAEQHPSNRLRDAGVDPEAVDTVVLTHLHWDHAYNTDLFPNARLIVNVDEVPFSRDPVADQRVLYESDVEGPSYLDGIEPDLIDGRMSLADGIEIVPLPGHTPGSQGLMVTTDAHNWVIAGDTVPLLDNLHSGNPSGIASDTTAFRHSLRWLAGLDAHVLPSHDPIITPFDGLDLVAERERWEEHLARHHPGRGRP